MMILRKLCISKCNVSYAWFRLSKISKSQGRPSIESSVRIATRYFLSKVENSNEERRLCLVCSHTTHGPKHETETIYAYKECNVDTCIVPCFVAYHTLSFLKKKRFFFEERRSSSHRFFSGRGSCFCFQTHEIFIYCKKNYSST